MVSIDAVPKELTGPIFKSRKNYASVEDRMFFHP